MGDECCGWKLSCYRMTLAVVVCLAASAAIPSSAWMPPSGDGRVANIDRWPPDSFHWSPHLYIIEHAIRILGSDGYENWADLAAQHLQELANGARYADKAGHEINLTWRVDILWFWTVYEDTMRLANSASLDHFYNPNEPNTHLGLDLQGWNALEKAGNWGKAISLLVTCLAGLPGLADASGDVSPDFPSRGKSAVDLCQEKYNAGVAADKNGAYSDAMFNLGWACHAIGDLGVVQHTYDSWITHEKYEEAADNKGNDARFHALSARPWGSPVVNYPEDLYQMVKNGVTPSQLAVATAKYVHTLEQFKWAEGANASPGGVMNEITRWATENGGPTDFDKALMRAIPVAERHTAALIARFMTDTGVPVKVPPVVGTVRDVKNNPVAGAYVFYCSRPDPNSYPTPWDYIRADDSGRFAFNIRPQYQYLIHPAMPDYTYKLKGNYIYNLPSGTQVQSVSDAAGWFVQQGGKVSNQIELVLEPLPKSVKISQTAAPGAVMRSSRRPSVSTRIPQPTPAPAASTVQMAGPSVITGINSLGNLRARLLTEHVSSAASPRPVIAAQTLLPVSKSVISASMADYLNESMLQIKAVRKGLQYNALGQPIVGDRLDDMKLTVAVPINDRDAERPYVLLQVNHLVGFAKGDVLRTPDEIVRTVDLARSSAKARAVQLADASKGSDGSTAAAKPVRPSAAPTRAETGRVRSIEGSRRVGDRTSAQSTADQGAESPQGRAFKLLSTKLPQSTLTLADGRQSKMVKLPPAASGYSAKTSLIANGMSLVPAQAGVRIEVRIAEAPGFLGPRAPGEPLVLTTDASGRAAFQLGPGGYPGRIRLLIKVVQDGEVSCRPETSLDFFVYPYAAADPVDANLPWLHEAAAVNL